MTVEYLARALYEAYQFRWYGGHDPDAPQWDEIPTRDVWRARALNIIEGAP